MIGIMGQKNIRKLISSINRDIFFLFLINVIIS
jgi:hypothetical protein